MNNKQKFLKLVSGEDTKTLVEVKERVKNHAMLRESQRIAIKILIRLDELHMTQKQLSEKMCVSPQYINKVVKGKENLTLETLLKLQDLLNISLLATHPDTKEQTTPTIRKQSVSTIKMTELQFLRGYACETYSNKYSKVNPYNQKAYENKINANWVSGF